MYLSGFSTAGVVCSLLDQRTCLHAGPPVDPAALAAPMRSALVGELLLEGEARTPRHADDIIRRRQVTLVPCQDVGAVPVVVVEDDTGRTAFAGLGDGAGRSLRFGFHDPATLERISWIRTVVTSLLDRAVAGARINLTGIVRAALAQGDECRSRCVAGTSLFLVQLFGRMLREDVRQERLAHVIRWLTVDSQLFGVFAMAAAKLLADSVHGRPGSPVVTAFASNGHEVGIRGERAGRPVVQLPGPGRQGGAARRFHRAGGAPDHGRVERARSRRAGRDGPSRHSRRGAPSLPRHGRRGGHGPKDAARDVGQQRAVPVSHGGLPGRPAGHRRTGVEACDGSAVGERLARFAALADVRYRRAHVAALREAAGTAEEYWGRPLEGVVHLAGADVSGQWAEVSSHAVVCEKPSEFHRMYRSKVLGTWAVGELPCDRPDASLTLFSSVNGHFGGSGSGVYASANSFPHGFADDWHGRLRRLVLCTAWSMWRGIGMRQGSPTPAAVLRRGFAEIPADCGAQVLLAPLAEPVVHLLAWLDPLNEHVAAELGRGFLTPAEAVVVYGSSRAANDEAVIDAVRECLTRSGLPARAVRLSGPWPRGHSVASTVPASSGPPGSPGAGDPAGNRARNGADDVIGEIWGKVPGRRSVGRADDFFELGGGSLDAVGVIDRVNAAFSARLAIHDLYDRPTVAELARHITVMAGHDNVNPASGITFEV